MFSKPISKVVESKESKESPRAAQIKKYLLNNAFIQQDDGNYYLNVMYGTSLSTHLERLFENVDGYELHCQARKKAGDLGRFDAPRSLNTVDITEAQINSYVNYLANTNFKIKGALISDPLRANPELDRMVRISSMGR